MATKVDLERARVWWVRHMGFLSPGHDRKVEALAEEFANARAEGVTEATAKVRVRVEQLEGLLAKLREQGSVVETEEAAGASGARVFTQAEIAIRDARHRYEAMIAERAGVPMAAADPTDDLVCRCTLDPRCPIHGGEA